MFNSISWSAFVTAIAVAAGAYYVIILATFFRNELSVLLNRKSALRDEEESEQQDDSHPVMGVARSAGASVPRERHRQREPQVILRNPGDPKDESLSRQTGDDLLMGTVADLLEEIKHKAEKISGWNKDEALPAFRELLQQYPQLKNTAYRDSINHFVSTQCDDNRFDWSVSPEEADQLWN